jgi:hypothetical protein
MGMAKFERIKPHISVGTIGHVNPNRPGSYARALLRNAAVAAALANVGNTSTTSTQSGWNNDSGTSTFVNTNNGPMMESGNREDRRNKKKRKHGPASGSKYKKGRWWE